MAAKRAGESRDAASGFAASASSPSSFSSASAAAAAAAAAAAFPALGFFLLGTAAAKCTSEAAEGKKPLSAKMAKSWGSSCRVQALKSGRAALQGAGGTSCGAFRRSPDEMAHKPLCPRACTSTDAGQPAAVESCGAL
eukprot:scaffold111885_cov19-Tisochrysis_lutea.AAC.1